MDQASVATVTPAGVEYSTLDCTRLGFAACSIAAQPSATLRCQRRPGHIPRRPCAVRTTSRAATAWRTPPHCARCSHAPRTRHTRGTPAAGRGDARDRPALAPHRHVEMPPLPLPHRCSRGRSPDPSPTRSPSTPAPDSTSPASLRRCRPAASSRARPSPPARRPPRSKLAPSRAFPHVLAPAA